MDLTEQETLHDPLSTSYKPCIGETIPKIMGDSTRGNSKGNGNIKCGNAKNSNNTTYNDCAMVSQSERKREILEWLSSLGSQGASKIKDTRTSAAEDSRGLEAGFSKPTNI